MKSKVNPMVWVGLTNRHQSEIKGNYVVNDSLEFILNRLCSALDVKKCAVKGRLRTREIADKRSIFCFVAREKGYTLQSIGDTIKRDHASVLHNVKKVNTYKYFDKDIQDYLKKVEYIRKT